MRSTRPIPSGMCISRTPRAANSQLPLKRLGVLSSKTPIPPSRDWRNEDARLGEKPEAAPVIRTVEARASNRLQDAAATLAIQEVDRQEQQSRGRVRGCARRGARAR